MIIKGNERGGARNLARHLLNAKDNEHIEVHSFRGTVARDVEGALVEMYAISTVTKCRNFLFSVSLSPPQDAVVPVEDFEATIAQIEERLGLGDKQRVVLFHEKEGRRHCHAVFSRIDGEDLKAINLPFYKERLNDIAREQFLTHGWELPKGFRDRSLSDPRNYTLEEYQVARRAKRDPREVKSVLRGCWQQSDSRPSFEAALQERGFYLCRGSRRGFVLMDWNGNVYSLSRWVNEKKKTLAAKLGEADALPSVEESEHKLAQLMTKKHRQFIVEVETAFQERMAPIEKRRKHLVRRQRQERKDLETHQDARQAQEALERQNRLRKGLLGFWDWITGNRAKTRRENEALLEAAIQRDRLEWLRLTRQHHNERIETSKRQIRIRRQRQISLADLEAKLEQWEADLCHETVVNQRERQLNKDRHRIKSRDVDPQPR